MRSLTADAAPQNERLLGRFNADHPAGQGGQLSPERVDRPSDVDRIGHSSLLRSGVRAQIGTEEQWGGGRHRLPGRSAQVDSRVRLRG
eukprot:6204458-Alexandrium_andersonii.AAC.1